MNNMYIIPIFVPHMGCPHKCVFCNQDEITGLNSYVNEKYVENTIKDYLKTIPKHIRTEVSFYGGSFTGIPIKKQSAYLNIAKRYLDDGKIDAIRLSTRPDYINDLILKNLKKYNVSIIELGVQSMDDEVLRKSQRGHTSKDVVNASKLIKNYNFTLGLQMMIGLPSDNREKSLYTADKIISLKPDFVRIYPTIIIKGTYLEKMFYDGIYKPLSLIEALNLSKELYIKFVRNDIDVIRVGLQTTKNINFGGDIIKGPFHPAFGQLVQSLIIKDILDYEFEKYKIYKDVVILEANPRSLSTIVGQKRSNKIYLEKKYDVSTKINQSSNILKNEIIIKYKDFIQKININECIKEINNKK